jgi:hypothetical protein
VLVFILRKAEFFNVQGPETWTWDGGVEVHGC